jgi:hypothetical protein
MNYRYLFSIVFIFLVTCCEKETPHKVLSVGQITYGDCKPATKKSGDSEYIEYETVDGVYLQMNHVNAWFNCEPGKIFVSAELNNDIIAVDEYEETALANCICAYDLSYRIGPLNYGKYLFKILRGGCIYAEFSINFNSDANGVFIIE